MMMFDQLDSQSMAVLATASCCILFCILRLHSVLHQLLYPYFVCRILGKAIDPRSLGHWAVVTGATDGIGLGFARRLAQRRLNLLLVGRSPAKLENVKEELRRDYPSIEVKTHAIDLSTQSLADYKALGEVLDQLQVGLLINNAGMSFDMPQYCADYSPETVQKLIAVNCEAVAQVTRLVLPHMVARRRGAVVNVSSRSALEPTPLLALYAASKAYVLHFSDCLRLEVADKGVVVQCLYPMFVATKMAKVRPSWWAPAPDAYAEEALKTLGCADATTGCMTHAFQSMLLNLLPASIKERFTLKAMLGIRAKALKRAAQKKE